MASGKMTHIRSFHQLADWGFSSPFQGFQLIKITSACQHLVAIETANLVDGSDTHDFRRSYGTSASSDTLEAKRVRRRVSMDERKSMVEIYVNRYREMNAGKFPTATDIKKNIGGSHYSIRKILQELIHYSKIPLMDNKDSVSLDKTAVKKTGPCDGPEEEVFQRKKLEHMIPISKVDIRDDSSKSFESKEGLQYPISDQSNVAKHDGPQSHRLVNKPRSSLRSDPEHNIKHKIAHEDKLNLNGLRPESELEQSTESDASERESSKLHTEDAEPPTKFSVWDNLRSFANGILGIWKRS